MEIEKRFIDELIPLERNVRQHSEKQIQEFARALKQFGQTRPFVLDEEGNILVGNGMYQAMRMIGADEVDCIVKYGLTENQKKKLIISDNRIFDLGQTDQAMSDQFIKELLEDGDKDIAGFSDKDIKDILGAMEKDYTEEKPVEQNTVKTIVCPCCGNEIELSK